VARKPEISDGVVLPLSVHKNPAVTCSQKSFSTYAGSLENEEEDWLIIEDGTENQDTPVGAAVQHQERTYRYSRVKKRLCQ